MNIIEEVLVGNIKMDDFVEMLVTDPNMYKIFDNMVPQEAFNNEEHPFWQDNCYSQYKVDGFDCFKVLRRLFRFDKSIGDNLSIFSTIKRAYTFHCSDIKCTTEYSDLIRLYLDSVASYYEGPEVDKHIEKIVRDSLVFKTKKDKIKYIKSTLKKEFQITERKPYWIQEGEWPATSEGVPMIFVSQKRTGELYEYTFKHPETGELRVVEQYT